MKLKLLKWIAITLILEIGLIHILKAQAEYEEAAYMGYLFAANFFGALAAAAGVYRKQFWGWLLGLVIALGSIAGYVWSRTLGMPGMNVEEWLNPFGIVSLGLEAGFILMFLFRPWNAIRLAEGSSTRPRFWFVLPAASLLLILSISALSFQWEYDLTQDYGHHVGSLGAVCRTPVTSMDDLEKEYGVQVSLVANSMMNSIVDVRLKIIDPEKAQLFLVNQAALLVGQEALILAPHMHSHIGTRLKAGKIFSIFFPTQQMIHSGSEVSLVFGPVRIASVLVE